MGFDVGNPLEELRPDALGAMYTGEDDENTWKLNPLAVAAAMAGTAGYGATKLKGLKGRWGASKAAGAARATGAAAEGLPRLARVAGTGIRGMGGSAVKAGKWLTKNPAGKLSGLGLGVFLLSTLKSMGYLPGMESDEDKQRRLELDMLKEKANIDRESLTASQDYMDKQNEKQLRENRRTAAMSMMAQNNRDQYNQASAFLDRYQAAKQQELKGFADFMGLV